MKSMRRAVVPTARHCACNVVVMRWSMPLLIAIATACQPEPAISVEPLWLSSAQMTTRALQMSIHAPTHVRYRADVLGSEPQPVELTFTNPSDEPVDVSGLNVDFRARRNGKAIACIPFHPAVERPSARLGPHASLVVDRDLCSLPVLGGYDIEALASFGSPWIEPVAATFHVDVEPSRHGNVPVPIGEHHELFAAMGATLARLPFTIAEWRSGAYHVALRLTNASDKVALLGVARITFRVTKDAKPLECSDTRDVTLPSDIGPGLTVTATVPVTCVVDVQGHYEIRAELELADNPTPTALGFFRVEITGDPLVFLPVLPY